MVNDSKFFIDKKIGFVIPTILFNISNVNLFISLVLFLLSIFKDDEDIIELENPSQLNSKKGRIPIGRILNG
ncbi:hypothetical protein LCGC14_1475910, partial [marine sediment metagenome]